MDGLVDEVFEKYGDAIYEKKISNQLNAIPKNYFDGKSRKKANEIRCVWMDVMYVSTHVCISIDNIIQMLNNYV